LPEQCSQAFPGTEVSSALTTPQNGNGTIWLRWLVGIAATLMLAVIGSQGVLNLYLIGELGDLRAEVGELRGACK
jgi:hypothetical protein